MTEKLTATASSAATFFKSAPPPAESWRASDYLSPQEVVPPAVLLILNQPLCKDAAFRTLWGNTRAHICADGGANRLYDAFANNEADRERFIPDYICGDFDSLRPDVRDWYAAQGTEIVHTSEQDSTDLQKCLNVIRTHLEGPARADSPTPETPSTTATITSRRLSRLFFPHCLGADCGSSAALPPPLLDVVIWGALSGRFDHTMSCIHTLFTLEPKRKVYLASNESLAVLLKPGSHEITCVRRLEGPTCGLLPIGVSVAKVDTKGLKWNLNRSMPMSFGGLVSTSNAFEENDEPVVTVKIETETPIVWTVEVNLA